MFRRPFLSTVFCENQSRKPNLKRSQESLKRELSRTMARTPCRLQLQESTLTFINSEKLMLLLSQEEGRFFFLCLARAKPISHPPHPAMTQPMGSHYTSNSVSTNGRFVYNSSFQRPALFSIKYHSFPLTVELAYGLL